eukprot:38336-Pleurochrysis_carterae.AAC.1
MHAVVPKSTSLLPCQRNAAGAQKSNELRLVLRCLADGARHLARAAAEAAVGEVLAMPEQGQFADKRKADADVAVARI